MFYMLLLKNTGSTLRPPQTQRGFSVVELLITVAFVGILSAIALPRISFATRPLSDSSNRLTSSFKMVRAKAMSQTSAYRVRPTSASSIKIERANACDAPNASDWQADGTFTISDSRMEQDIAFVNATENDQARSPSSGWSICFNGRGMANKNLVLTLQNQKDSKQKRIEVFRGGTVQTYDDDL